MASAAAPAAPSPTRPDNTRTQIIVIVVTVVVVFVGVCALQRYIQKALGDVPANRLQRYAPSGSSAARAASSTNQTGAWMDDNGNVYWRKPQPPWRSPRREKTAAVAPAAATEDGAAMTAPLGGGPVRSTTGGVRRVSGTNGAGGAGRST